MTRWTHGRLSPWDRHLIPAPVCQCLVVHTLMDYMSKNSPSTPMTHVACESKLRSVVRSFMHPYTGNLVTIGRAVVYQARAALTRLLHELNVDTVLYKCTVLLCKQLTISMLRLLPSNVQGQKAFKTSKTFHVGIHWIALT